MEILTEKIRLWRPKILETKLELEVLKAKSRFLPLLDLQQVSLKTEAFSVLDTEKLKISF